ncbi:hypothetical protein [Paraburkholderia dilworthii]|uniref:hypothetical protein n=1 Tax=Paraburkholderia dilworthii TaxID=948106 RepID=UPI000405F1C4|nr:hypothetical protein [Paraburkholderia dilworthii]
MATTRAEVSCVYTAGDYSGARSPHYNQATLAIDYLLSKRTDTFLTGVYQRASGPGAFAQIYTTAASSSNSQTLVQRGYGNPSEARPHGCRSAAHCMVTREPPAVTTLRLAAG